MPDKKLKHSISIFRNGAEVSSKHLYSMTVEFGFSMIPKATIIIRDDHRAEHIFAESEKQEWQVGENIEIKIGYQLPLDLVFSGIITKQGIRTAENKNIQLYIELSHRYYLSSIKKTSRIFLDQKDSDAIEEILNEYNFPNEIDATQEFQPQLVQFNSSDFDFVNLRAEANNSYVIPKDEKFIVKNIIIPPDENVTLIEKSSILKFDLEVDSQHSFESFITNTWDFNNQEVLEQEATELFSETAGSASSVEIAKKSNHGHLELVGLGSISEIEAASISNRKKVNAELSKIRGSITCSGGNNLTIGDWILLEGVGKPFCGKLLVTRILHNFSAGKWETTYHIGTHPKKYGQQVNDNRDKPASDLLPGMSGLQIGFIKKLESNQDDEKILVQLPYLRQGEVMVWARCARMEAGNQRGWVFRPEIGDEVILGFINDDPRQAMILGSMHSSKNSAPIFAEDQNNLKGYFSRENLKLIFDDGRKIISILTPFASIELNDDTKKIIIKNDTNTIEISEYGIKMETQKDFKIKAEGDIELAGRNVKLNATAQFSAEGNTGIKISSPAITEIKGTLVKIN